MKIQETKNGQYFLTLPKGIVKAMGWAKNNEITFEIMGKDKLKLERVKNTPHENTGGIYP